MEFGTYLRSFRLKRYDGNQTLVCFAVCFLLAVILNSAWVTEDAYITFRSIEQLFAGNGPRWNPHERVQVFTHPLWFILLSFWRVVSSNLYIGAIVLSLVCSL